MQSIPILHNAFEGNVVQGTHPPLISKELFLQVHGIMIKGRSNGYKCKKENEFIPMKNFLQRDYEKVQTQYLMFSEGISYSKKTDECRTKQIDPALLTIALLS